MISWRKVTKFDAAAVRLADGHYSRRKPGSPQFMPPGQTIVMLTPGDTAVFGWWRPDPRSGIRAMNGLDGWTCSIFRRTPLCLWRASELILDAETELARAGHGCGPDGMLTYVWDAKVASANPGYCFKAACWHIAGRMPCCGHMRPRSADGKKTLLHKPFERAGLLLSDWRVTNIAGRDEGGRPRH